MDTSLTNKRQKMTMQAHGPPQPAFSLHFGHDASHSSSVIAADGQTICLRCATKVVAEAGSDGNAGAQAALQQLFAETMTILTKEPTHLDLHARECVELSSTTISALIAPESALAAVCNMRRCCLDLVLLIAWLHAQDISLRVRAWLASTTVPFAKTKLAAHAFDFYDF